MANMQFWCIVLGLHALSRVGFLLRRHIVGSVFGHCALERRFNSPIRKWDSFCRPGESTEGSVGHSCDHRLEWLPFFEGRTSCHGPHIVLRYDIRAGSIFRSLCSQHRLFHCLSELASKAVNFRV